VRHIWVKMPPGARGAGEEITVHDRKKAWVAVLLAWVGIGAFAGISGASEVPLTADGAVTLALEHNPMVLVLQEKISQDEAQVREARAAGGPKLDALLAYTRVNEAPRSVALDPVTGNPVGVVPLGFESAYKVALQLSQVIFSGGSIEAKIQSARWKVRATEAERSRTLQGVANGARRAYYSVKRAGDKLAVAEEARSLAQEHLKQVESFFRNGVVAKNEVLRVEVDVAGAELAVIRAQNAVDVAWTALERAVGAPLRSSWTLAEGEEGAPVPHEGGDPESRALASRPEIRMLESSRQAALFLAEAAAGAAKPQVMIQGEVGRQGDSFFPEEDEWKITLAAQWRLYDSGEVAARVDQARGVARELLARIGDLESQVRLEVSTARFNLTSAQASVGVAHNQVASAEEDYRMALKRYEAQVGTNLDVLDARLALNQARTALVDAIYDAWSADADLRYAVGEEDFVPASRGAIKP